MDQSKEMARIAYNALSDKKGEDIKIIDIHRDLRAGRLLYHRKRKQ